MELVILVGPPGSGKSTLAKEYQDHARVSQDDQGKEGHMDELMNAIAANRNIIVDRMGFNRIQRTRYLQIARAAGYTTKIMVLHESYDTCLTRMLKRIADGHPTIMDEKSARSALHTFFSKYERPTEDEADEIEFRYPTGHKPEAIICDLDGTLCDTTHRQHYVQKDNGKKDWRGFFAGMDKDPINKWCEALLRSIHHGSNRCIIYCSGRGNEYRQRTKDWLKRFNVYHFCYDYNHTGEPIKEHLYMRFEKDNRVDWQIKENILDFELLTRFTVLFAIDDRQQVVDMWRRRGITCLQCAKGDF